MRLAMVLVGGESAVVGQKGRVEDTNKDFQHSFNGWLCMDYRLTCPPLLNWERTQNEGKRKMKQEMEEEEQGDGVGTWVQSVVLDDDN